jgi:hypothetical protein
VGGLHAEAIAIERNSVLLQSVEGGSGCRFAGRKVKACMMPRAPNGRARDHALVKRTTEVRAICIVSLKLISFSPDEDAGFADNASKDSTSGAASTLTHWVRSRL